jgi:polar amino acid transport system substrate-binding protein
MNIVIIRNRSFLTAFMGLCLLVANSLNAASSCNLTLGMSNWLPYQAISESGEPHGLQVELIEQIAAQAKCTLKYRSMTFQAGLKELEQGTVDFLVNATPSEERSKIALFSIPYRNEFLLLYSTQKYLEKCHRMTLEELIRDGFRLGIQYQLYYGEELRLIQQSPELNRLLRYVESNVQHVDLVESEDLDGIIDDPVVVSYRSTINPERSGVLKSCPIQISTSPVSMMFSKKSVSKETVERFNRAILAVQATPEYRKRWSW